MLIIFEVSTAVNVNNDNLGCDAVYQTAWRRFPEARNLITVLCIDNSQIPPGTVSDVQYVFTFGSVFNLCALDSFSEQLHGYTVLRHVSCYV